MDLSYVLLASVQKRVKMGVPMRKLVTIVLMPPKMMDLVNIKVVIHILSAENLVVFLVKLGAAIHALRLLLEMTVIVKMVLKTAGPAVILQ
jgi:hypothetical protein